MASNMGVQDSLLTRPLSVNRRTLWTRVKEHRTLYLMFFPILVYFIGLRYWPIVLAWVVAFKNLELGLGVWNSQWVGFQNFQTIVSSPDVLLAIRNTIEISLLRLIFGFWPPIILAIFFHDMISAKYKKVTQTFVYIPHFFSWVIVYGITFAFFSTGTGLVNDFIAWLGHPRYEFFLNSSWFRPLLVGSAIWKELGWGTIIYLAALTGVDPELYEAAAIDGAGPVKRILHITFPSILPVITFVLCINLGNILFAGGEQILLFYNDAVLNVADVIDTWVYREGLANMQFSIGTAVGLMQSFIGTVLIVISNYFAKRYTGRGIW